MVVTVFFRNTPPLIRYNLRDLARIQPESVERPCGCGSTPNLSPMAEAIERQVMPRDAAVEFFKGLGEHYKAEIISAIPPGEDISLYRQDGFVDLCRGPHVPSTMRKGPPRIR